MLAQCDDISVSGRDSTRGYGNPKGSSFICLEKSQKASWRRRHLSGVLNDKKIRQRRLERYKKGQERTEQYNRNLIEQFNKIIPMDLEKDEALRLWKKYNYLMPPPDVISKYKSETDMSWTEFAMFVEKTY